MKIFGGRGSNQTFYAYKIITEYHTGTPRELCERFGSFTVEYNTEDGKRLVKFFRTREEAKQFYAEKESEGAVLRGTHLEDVFLEYSGKIDVSRIEEVMG